MVKRVVTKIGNIFCVEVDDTHKRFFQYITTDMSVLNSSVIRFFKKTYPIDWKPDMDVIVDDEVDFYAHTVLSVGTAVGTVVGGYIGESAGGYLAGQVFDLYY